MTTETITTSLTALRSQSEALWELAADTCIDAEGREQPRRRRACEEAAESASEAWARALVAAEAGDMPAAREALEEARSLGAEWGEDGPERDGLRLAEAHG
jgi:hypothetical protein